MAEKIKKIISCSRRTDIPTFNYDWLQEVLGHKTITTRNPMFTEKEYTYNISPEEVKCIVLWSKDFRNVLANAGRLDDYNLIFNYTITGYSKILEPKVPDYNTSIKVVEKMLDKYLPDQMALRWDPILLSEDGEVHPTPGKLGNARLAHLDTMCKDVSSIGIKSLTFSFAELYPQVKRRLEMNNFKYLELNDDIKILFAKRMVEIASKYGVTLKSCSQPLLENVEGIKKSHCIDADLIERIFGTRDGKVSRAKASKSGQRESCGCVKSIDIGSYNTYYDHDKQETKPFTCKHGCLYCYSSGVK